MSIQEQSVPEPTTIRTNYIPRLRIASGLVLFTFAITHFLNHSLGLISLDVMQAVQDARRLVTQSNLGTAVLLSAMTVHVVLGIARFMGTRSLGLGRRDIIQLIFGLLIPVFLIRHVMGTRGVQMMFDVDADYGYVLWVMWTDEALSQAVLMMLVWVHGCIGVHHWLSIRPWYHRSFWLWNALAVSIPVLAYAGFVSAGRMNAGQSRYYYNPTTSAQDEILATTVQFTNTVYYGVILAALGIWLLLLILQRFSKRIVVTYDKGLAVSAVRGLSVLEVSRAHRIPHASVCGGRARCSTCRVRVIEGLEAQPSPNDVESRVLKRVAAPANVRLACQLRPNTNLTISTLLPGTLDATHLDTIDQYNWGVEKDATILFCDLRGFTKISEGKLSYDVVFLLNQFLGQMAEAIQDSGGYVDKFMGDGIMAIFGMKTSVQDGAVDAITAARAMSGVLDGLNQSLSGELSEPLRIGIGINTGPVVLGRIGAGRRTDAAARITALGETVNTASRLEGLTKSLDVQLIVSMETMEASKLPVCEKMERRKVDIRGLSQRVAVYTVLRATDLPASVTVDPQSGLSQ